MSDTADSKSLDNSTASRPSKSGRKKFRPTYSCLSCHKRKVKCDRVKPCSACCLRGTPSECEYGNSKQDRHYIQQSALIESLMQSCQTLKQQLDEVRRLANLPPLKGESGQLSPPLTNNDDVESPVVSKEESQSPVNELEFRSKSHRSSPEADSTALVRTAHAHVGQSSKQAGLSPTSPGDTISFQSPAMAKIILEVLVERLIDNFSPQDQVNCGSIVGLRPAAEMRVFSPLLYSAFEAASLTFVGRQQGILNMERAGHVRYTKVLRSLQNALFHPERSKSTEVLVVVVLFTIIEAFKQSSKDAVLRHQLGGLELLRSRTPYRHRHSIERSIFVDLRQYWVTTALVHRRPSFLADKAWMTVPWPADAPPKNILHRLLDIAVEIPGFLAQIDDFSAALKTGHLPAADLVSLQSAIWEKAADLEHRLEVWKTMCADTYSYGRPWEEVAHAQDSEFPTFKCRNLSTMHIVTPPTIAYPDLLLAQSTCFYWAMRLVISTADSGVVSIVAPHERYELACNIARSMKYYVQTAPGCLASRMMFVLRVAFDTFADGMVEKQSVAEMFAYIGEKLRLTVFTNRCSESSVKIKPVD